ncbi:MAG: hypothetical protein ACJAYB_003589 [Psychromonas sp.]|jgi:hypothetical protein
MEITFTWAIGTYYKAVSLRDVEIYHGNITFTGEKWNNLNGSTAPSV